MTGSQWLMALGTATVVGVVLTAGFAIWLLAG